MNDLFKPDDTRDALRKIGGLLFGLGAAMIYIRKGPFLTVNPSQWASFPMFLVLAIPAVYLYGVDPDQAPDRRASRRGRSSIASSA